MQPMTPNIEELITINYELEGLLYLALHRGDDTPTKVWDLIREKIESLKSGIITDNCNADAAEECSTPVVVDEIITEEVIPEKTTEETVIEDTVTEEVTDDESTDEPEEMPIVVKASSSNVATQDELSDETKRPVTEPTAELRLDEKLARQNSVNLRKAFSLNDRFRFKRELFGNSDERMNEALDRVEAMHSVEEAHNYFYDTLHLDKKSPDVIDFMEIVEHHLSAK